MTSRAGYILLLMAAGETASPAAAQSVQPWPTIAVSVPLAPKWRLSGEIIGRIAGDVRPSEIKTQFLVSRALTDSVVVSAGYAHVDTYDPIGSDRLEDRAVQQVAWAIGKVGGIDVASRTRIEQRFQRSVSETAWRLRQQVRLELPFRHNGPAGVTWVEPYIALNHTTTVRTTFDQVRGFIGVKLPIAPFAAMETGYLYQYIHRVTGDIHNDVIPIVLTLQF